MKKVLAILVAFALVFTPICIQNPTEASAANVETYIGDMKLTKINGIFTDPTLNVMILLTPGQSLGALYYTRLYAEWDSTQNAYIVVEKIAAHRSSSRTVGTNGIGLALNYAPLSSTGNTYSKANWLIFDRIRVGDKLTLSGVDVANKTCDVSGTWGTSSFVSNALVKVTTVRDPDAPKTAYSDKKIVAMGDSVTVGGGWTYKISETFNTDVINSGFGGDTSTNYYNARYQQYVAAYNPDIVFVSFGVNDALSANGSAAGIETYKNTLRNIYKSNTALGAKTIFMTPNNINISMKDSTAYSAYGGLQGYLDAFLGGMKEVAEELDCHFIDIYTMWRENNYAPDCLISGDATHPTSEGYDHNIELILSYLTENMNDICDVPDHPSELTVKTGSGAAISGDFLTGVDLGVTGTSVKALFNEDAGYISIKDTNGTEVTNGIVGTSYTVNLVVDGAVVKSYAVVILGDVTGDGTLGAADYIAIKGALNSTLSINDACTKAADLDGSGGLSTTDYIAMKQKLS